LAKWFPGRFYDESSGPQSTKRRVSVSRKIRERGGSSGGERRRRDSVRQRVLENKKKIGPENGRERLSRPSSFCDTESAKATHHHDACTPRRGCRTPTHIRNLALTLSLTLSHPRALMGCRSFLTEINPSLTNLHQSPIREAAAQEGGGGVVQVLFFLFLSLLPFCLR